MSQCGTPYKVEELNEQREVEVRYFKLCPPCDIFILKCEHSAEQGIDPATIARAEPHVQKSFSRNMYSRHGTNDGFFVSAVLS